MTQRHAFLPAALLGLFLVASLWIALPAQVGQAQEAPGTTDIDALMTRVWQRAAERVAPSVVMLTITRTSDVEVPPYRGQRTGNENPAARQRPDGPVSGLIVSADGNILTANYNLTGEIDTITVTLADGRVFPATMLGRNEDRDLGMIHIDVPEGEELPVPEFREDTAELRVGQMVALMGRSQNPLQFELTTGIISAFNRLDNHSMQFSAQANYGNTGGPLIDLRGRVVGLAGYIRPNTSHGLNSAVAFGTAWHLVAESLDAMAAGEVIPARIFPYMGVNLGSTAEGGGVTINSVMNGTPAERAGLQRGDVLLRVDDHEVGNADELHGVLAEYAVGDVVRLTIRRGDQEMVLELTLGQRE